MGLMKQGIAKKRETDGKLFIERKMLGMCDVLEINRNLCVGCKICADTCPKEALELLKAMVQNGKLLKRSIIQINVDKCNFCGICAVICPVNAIEMFRNGNEIIPVVEAGVFPSLLKNIEVNAKKCVASCKIVCKESCPTEAITVTLQGNKEITEILDVNVDKKKCIFCKKCESTCPQGAIKVTRPLQGLIRLNANLCPENCQACMDVCPSKALTLESNGALRLKDQFCIYCGACQEVCPKTAIEVKRTKVFHTQIKSGVWTAVLEKLTSPQYMTKELSAKSVRKLKETVKKANLF